MPAVQAPNIGGLTEASNTAGAAAQQAVTPGQGSGNAQPSIIIVEVLGFGGGGGNTPDNSEKERRRKTQGQRSYNTNGAVQVLGHGDLTDQEKQLLNEDEKRRL